MNDREWELLIKSIDEIRADVKDVKREMNSLKVKVAGVAAFIGSIFGAIFK